MFCAGNIGLHAREKITANNENFCVIFLTCHLPKNISFAANNA